MLLYNIQHIYLDEILKNVRDVRRAERQRSLVHKLLDDRSSDDTDEIEGSVVRLQRNCQ